MAGFLKRFNPLFVWAAAIGAFAWGLIGLFNFNIVEALLGGFPIFLRVVYVVVGVGGVMAIAALLSK